PRPSTSSTARPGRRDRRSRPDLLPSRTPRYHLHHASGRSQRPGKEARMSDLMDSITSLAKRRGLVFPSSEIYAGLSASWYYGPLGVELKNNVKRAWWRSMVQTRDDVVGLD